jgi:ATP-dependent RNA helicase DeaD
MKKFKDFPLSPALLQAISDLGYEAPSPIQAEALPLLLGTKTDFLGLAATGTGKTAAFALPMLDRIDEKSRGVKALVLCPTRELALQVAGQINLLGKYKNLKTAAIYGGAGYGDQIRALKDGARIVVGTPGRVVDHLDKGTLRLDQLELLVLDEADEMISMGFKDDLEMVLKSIPRGQANTWLFSATMGREVRRVADAYLKDPLRVQVNRVEMLPDTVEQIYYMVHEYDKPELLSRVIEAADDFYGIIFCQTKSLVADVTKYLQQRGQKADCLHGDMDQKSRERVMGAFRERRFNVLVATDVACRGLDVKDISHVINYSIPRELDSYVHRIGRTGRSGKSGVAASFVTNSHRALIGQIEQKTKSKLRPAEIPSLKDIAKKKLLRTQRLFAEKEQTAVSELLGDAWESSISHLSKEEIVARFLSLLHPELEKSEARPRIDAPKSQPPRAHQAHQGERRERRGHPGDRRMESRDRGESSDRGGKPAWKRKSRPAPWGGGTKSHASPASPKKKWDKKPFSAKKFQKPWEKREDHKSKR